MVVKVLLHACYANNRNHLEGVHETILSPGQKWGNAPLIGSVLIPCSSRKMLQSQMGVGVDTHDSSLSSQASELTFYEDEPVSPLSLFFL
jgi:hypothetical protein